MLYKEEMICITNGPTGSVQIIFTARKSYVLFDPETQIDSICKSATEQGGCTSARTHEVQMG